ncbi:hypothetical protein A2886_03285 [candidate division WWE3 bacterium RIFCSPHIGHO2_01_FULL_42_13]|uniref:Uncharacterized protein n=1 Tax=candidate division WWE3 bacterium RIFCSPHIGHO2_01_FULL_42_13 TaxID=1802617 RepID=A0A1F4USG3_UNCKA|nr:MAG: hypothetical protein A2886_03285 [candidate division WWE3 bacterium RIFCSPHIGHO2_01_FULL_42_13]
MKSHLGNLGLFVVFLILLGLPFGSFGAGKIMVNKTSVLSEQSVRKTEQRALEENVEEVSEVSESSEGTTP